MMKVLTVGYKRTYPSIVSKGQTNFALASILHYYYVTTIV